MSKKTSTQKRTPGSLHPAGCAARAELLALSEHPYDRGYWSRYNGLPMPKEKQASAGWKDCDKELVAEAESQHNADISRPASK